MPASPNIQNTFQIKKADYTLHITLVTPSNISRQRRITHHTLTRVTKEDAPPKHVRGGQTEPLSELKKGTNLVDI